MKTQIQNVPFKCNLQRYTVELRARDRRALRGARGGGGRGDGRRGGALHVESS